MQVARTLLVPDLRWSPSRALTDLALVVGASVLTALAARVEIPLGFTPVPITGQTFAVLLTGALLGWSRGAAAMALYLLEGAVGLPVFAGGASGVPRLLGPTGGYLWSYPLAAALTGWLAERGADRRFWSTVLAMLAGSAVIFALGVTWLATFVGKAALAKGLLPFIPGDILKAGLAAALLPPARRHLTPDADGETGPKLPSR
jgi:biotin transport system substrate-specific component